MSAGEFNGRYSVMTQKEYVDTLFAELPGGTESQALLEEKYDHLERIKQLEDSIESLQGNSQWLQEVMEQVQALREEPGAGELEAGRLAA
jgi:hypothetical protein